MKTDMDNKKKYKLRENFHQAKWDEPIIFELHTPGERGILVPEAEQEVIDEAGDIFTGLPENLVREDGPALPEVSQMRVLKHFLRLSQQCLGADFNIDIGQGTCTVKYNPKINKVLASAPEVAELHPWQNDNTVQGALEIMYKFDTFLREISGLDRFSLQPSSGSSAIFIMASMVHAYHVSHGEADKRDEIITTIFSHPSDAAAAAVKGYKVITLYHDEDGLVSLDALKEAVSERTAALFIANPEDTGIFNPQIADFTKIVHEAGGLCGYDQANANGILGITRAKEAGFDLCFFNLHKTFSAPHGCGGPASGALGVTDRLAEFLPSPVVDFDGEKYFLNYDIPNTIGKTRGFYGVFPVILKAYAWVMSLGAAGLKEAAQVAVLNNNYLLENIKNIKGAASPFPAGKHRIEQVRYTWEKLFEDTGVTTEDVTLHLADFGFHLWSSHHPFVVPQPFTIEPTEAYSKDELDEYIEGLRTVVKEAYENPEKVKGAPYNSVVHKIDHSTLDDPEKWAITWRSYLKKHVNKRPE